jgi:hypothetical protein
LNSHLYALRVLGKVIFVQLVEIDFDIVGSEIHAVVYRESHDPQRGTFLPISLQGVQERASLGAQLSAGGRYQPDKYEMTLRVWSDIDLDDSLWSKM